MVIEDDLSLAELLNHELQDSGFHVSYHNSGKKALEQIKIMHQMQLFWTSCLQMK